MASSKFALVQMATEFLNVDHNIATAERLLNRAAENGAQIALLPELFNTGWCPNRESEMGTLAEPIDGKTITKMAELAKSLGIWIVAPIFLKEVNKNPSNAAILLDDQGKVRHIYRKTHPTRTEDAFITRGTDYTPCETPFGKLGFLICNDISFPESARIFALNGAEILCVVAAWHAGHSFTYLQQWWDRALAARALDNQLFIAACDQHGYSDCGYFAGSSKFFAPNGDVLTYTGFGEDIVYYDINPALVYAERNNNTSLADRRPEDYSPLSAVPTK